MDKTRLLSVFGTYKRPENATFLAYGTAGFRTLSDMMDYVMFRVGLVASLRCRLLSRTMGVMITASHNPGQDNGVKIVEPNGEMLGSDWEPIVERVVNSEDHERLYQELMSIKDMFKIDLEKPGRIFIGRDTRDSGQRLLDCLKCGLVALGTNCTYVDYGMTTTPIVHFLVAQSNLMAQQQIGLFTYYDRFISAFEEAYKVYDARSNKLRIHYEKKLVIDSANGIGQSSVTILKEKLQYKKHLLEVSSINQGSGPLNDQCGADYVKTKGLPPSNAVERYVKHASFDGDADRLVYFYLTEDRLELIDGDKIACLFAIYLKKLLQESGLEESLSMAIIQTAYANGASTAYITNDLGIKVDCVDTGVKNLHRQAQQYDLAVYFEANGHGTIFISDEARNRIQDSGSDRLKLVDQIINPCIGDAFTDILLVETILRQFDWSIKKWAEIYRDRPNVLSKLAIKDKSAIRTIDAGTRCVSPPKLQDSIDMIVSQFGSNSRCFVRPSGTENVVRIYAEASALDDAKKLADLVAQQVKIHID